MSKYLKKITELFPSWTNIYKDPENSNGGKYIKQFAEFLDNIDNIISDLISINNLDTNPIDYEGYQLSKIDFVGKALVNEKEITNCKNLWVVLDNKKEYVKLTDSTFFFFFSKEPVAYYDSENTTLYLNKITDLFIDGKRYSIFPHHVWGPYDEIGLLINCPRQPLEKNKKYRLRLRETWRDFGNSSPEKLKRFIIRSLMPYESSLDETVEFIELTDKYIAEQTKDGNIPTELKTYIEQSKRINHNYDNSYWDIIDENNKSLQFLPISWNNSIKILKEADIQNGVLRPQDLEIYEPSLEDTAKNVEIEIYGGNRVEEETTTYKETGFEYFIENTDVENTKDEQEINIQVEGSENINLKFDIIAEISFNSLITCFLNTDNKIQIHSENNKNESIALDKIVESSDNTKLSLTNTEADLSTGLLTDNYKQSDSLDLLVELITANGSSPKLRSICIYYDDDNCQDGEWAKYTIGPDILNGIIGTKNEEGISVDIDGGLTIADDTNEIILDNEEYLLHKKENVEIIKDEYSNSIGISLS